MAPLSRLKESVDHLNEQLANADHLGDAERQSLESLLAEVARVLDREDDYEPDHEGLAEQLREATEDFEEAYPRLTHAVGRVIDALSGLGI
jgi:hypothetical protein